MSAPPVLDLRGLKCPQPVLRTRKRLQAMAPGACLVVECTDPLAVIDLPNLLREIGADLLQLERDSALLRFHIRKGGS